MQANTVCSGSDSSTENLDYRKCLGAEFSSQSLPAAVGLPKNASWPFFSVYLRLKIIQKSASKVELLSGYKEGYTFFFNKANFLK